MSFWRKVQLAIRDPSSVTKATSQNASFLQKKYGDLAKDKSQDLRKSFHKSVSDYGERAKNVPGDLRKRSEQLGKQARERAEETTSSLSKQAAETAKALPGQAAEVLRVLCMRHFFLSVFWCRHNACALRFTSPSKWVPGKVRTVHILYSHGITARSVSYRYSHMASVPSVAWETSALLCRTLTRLLTL